jgi:hypothetical protein
VGSRRRLLRRGSRSSESRYGEGGGFDLGARSQRVQLVLMYLGKELVSL